MANMSETAAELARQERRNELLRQMYEGEMEEARLRKKLAEETADRLASQNGRSSQDFNRPSFVERNCSRNSDTSAAPHVSLPALQTPAASDVHEDVKPVTALRERNPVRPAFPTTVTGVEIRQEHASDLRPTMVTHGRVHVVDLSSESPSPPPPPRPAQPAKRNFFNYYPNMSDDPRYSTVVTLKDNQGYAELRCKFCKGNAKYCPYGRHALFRGIQAFHLHVKQMHPDHSPPNQKLTMHRTLEFCLYKKLTQEEVSAVSSGDQAVYSIPVIPVEKSGPTAPFGRNVRVKIQEQRRAMSIAAHMSASLQQTLDSRAPELAAPLRRGNEVSRKRAASESGESDDIPLSQLRKRHAAELSQSVGGKYVKKEDSMV